MTGESADRRRRYLLRLVASGYVASHVPWAFGQPVASGDEDAFLALSFVIAGRQGLDPALSRRLFDAFVADDPDFRGAVRALLELIVTHKIDVLDLQSVLDRERSPLAALPRKIATAWFLGIVGSGDDARCLAYEDALNAVIVSDVLKPPTYCYGPYGAWTRRPI